jgi:hypothetical protein
MFTWTGWLLVPAPLLLAWDYFRRRDPLALIVLLLLTVVTALTGWQARWNPWQAAIFSLALPWMLAPLKVAHRTIGRSAVVGTWSSRRCGGS